MASGVTVGAFRNRNPLRGEPNLEVAVRGPPSPRCSHLREHLGNELGGTVRVGRRRPFESKLDAAKELYALWPPWSVARKRAACCSASRLRRLPALSLRLASSSRFLQFAIGGGSAVPEMHRQTFAGAMPVSPPVRERPELRVRYERRELRKPPAGLFLLGLLAPILSLPACRLWQ